MPIPIDTDNMLLPRPGTPVRSLVVLLHGVGANGADLMSLAERWSADLADAVFLSPDGPHPYDGIPDGADWGMYQWFSLDGITEANRYDRVQAAAPDLDAYLNAQLERYGLGDERLCLVGFSQGTIMALHVALRRPRPCAGILGYSGRLAGAAGLGEEIRSRPRVFLIHGQADTVISVQEFRRAQDALRENGVPVIGWAVPHLMHGIHEGGEDKGGRFLRYCLSHDPEQGLGPLVQTLGALS